MDIGQTNFKETIHAYELELKKTTRVIYEQKNYIDVLEKRIKVKDSIYLEVVADNRVDLPHAVTKVRAEPAADMDVCEHS